MNCKIVSGAILLAPLFTAAMDNRIHLIMPRVILTREATKIKEKARCFLDERGCYLKGIDCDESTGESTYILRDIAKRTVGFHLTGDDYLALSNDHDLLLAWLAVMDDQMRNEHLKKLVNYLATHEKQDMLQYLEWHGLKANRFNHDFLDELARDNDAAKLKKYVLSLKNPKEYDHEGIFQEREIERRFEDSSRL